MNKKLEQLGIRLPLLPLTSVGSFPKTEAVRQMRKHFPGTFTERREIEREATQYWLNVQEELGYHVLVHGEMERGDMVAYFSEGGLGGIRPGDAQEPVRSFGNRFWVPPEISGPVLWDHDIMVHLWEGVQQMTQRPLKGMLTGPATIYDWSLDKFYGQRYSAVLDIARALRHEIEALLEAGAKIIQIDEPSLAHMAAHFDTLEEAFHLMLDGLEERAYFIMHTCYGQDEFESLYARMLALPVDNLDLETANSNMALLASIEKFPIRKDLSLGIVDVHDHRIESVNVVRDRIRRALEVVPRDRLWLKPDCGLKTRTVEGAVGKLEVVAKARKAVMSTLS